MSRRTHYSTALTQSYGIVEECLSLFEIWNEGMSINELFDLAQSSNTLNLESERRIRNIVIEGFGSRFLRPEYVDAAPALKKIFAESRDHTLLTQIIMLYALRQHGIFFDFLRDEYWPAVRSGGLSIRANDVMIIIDQGLVTGRLKKNWSENVRKNACSNVLGIATDFQLLGASRASERPILNWSPHDSLILYLAYDLHFSGASDDEVANSEEWQTLGLQREDVTLYLNRLQNQGHLLVQDTGHLCRIEWKYNSREELSHVIIH